MSQQKKNCSFLRYRVMIVKNVMSVMMEECRKLFWAKLYDIVDFHTISKLFGASLLFDLLLSVINLPSISYFPFAWAVNTFY